MATMGEGTTLSNSLDVIPADRTWRSSPLPKPSGKDHEKYVFRTNEFAFFV